MSIVKKDAENEEIVKKIARATIEYLKKHPQIHKDKITNIKGRFAKKYNYNGVIKNAKVLEYVKKSEDAKIRPILKRRSTRTLSGVSVIAIMTKPLPCPGVCVYCPGKESQPGKKVAKSYTGQEPAALRSIHNNYDPYLQVRSRIDDLEAIGHKVDKIELIIMGGTFLSTDHSYQEHFIKGAYEAIINKKVKTLTEAKRAAETSKKRLIGLTIETRPDYCDEKFIDLMLDYGTTRVELGVQTVFNDIYNLVNRGHTIKDSIKAIRIAKDAGLKINAHIMPNLPGSDYNRDLETFKILFTNPDYRPDMLKIYPCLVLKGTELYNWWKEGKYTPYSTEKLVELIASAKKELPPYVRIQRVMRDIPAPLIEAGCNKSNLRQLVQEKLKKDGTNCNCIRCREYGISANKQFFNNKKDLLDGVRLRRLDYEASKGYEVFLSYEHESENLLFGYLRLRKPSNLAHRSELSNGNTMIVREVRVVGELVPTDIEPQRKTQIQHRGFGKKLMENAEKIAREEFDVKKLSVISGIGARDWFYHLGFTLDGPYVSKSLI
ncbi:MAG: tRNA uridine(34) 5-carboxymethylaminomethyl modification radical SAM/GNAT enzyme Elp3 [Promethearchaeota archaeon]|nr:MAG: tRNA uridine(34) 5-carboxymethylaminomethyl modification radical SAM/GNAT enzyme Elp3 [Candidatus Lokiarchaeota archaeon]